LAQYSLRPSWFSDPVYPNYPEANPGNTTVARVKNTSTTQKIGPAILLKVMAGDSYNIRVASGWNDGATSTNSSSGVLNDLVLALSSGLPSASGGKVTQTQLQDPSSGLSTAISSFLSNESNSGAPKAYVNWILFDEQFHIAKDANGNIMASGYSGFDQVKTNGSTYVHNLPGLSVAKSGYLYIYVSNESQNIDVFFDNLQVTHIHGPIVEETHYYPFGLVMSGISSKALGFGSPENKRHKFQNQEYNNDFDIDMYEFKWRMDDPQIGRFWQVDPLSDKYSHNSPYAFSENKVINAVELEGLEAVTLMTGYDLMWGVKGSEGSAGVAFDGEGIAALDQSGSKKGGGGNIGLALTVGIYTAPSISYLNGESVTTMAGGEFVAGASVGYTDLGDYSGFMVSVGLGIGAEYAVEEVNTTVYQKLTWSSAASSLGFKDGRSAFNSFKNRALNVVNTAIDATTTAVINTANNIGTLGNDIKALNKNINQNNKAKITKQIDAKTQQILKLDKQLKQQQRILTQLQDQKEKLKNLQYVDKESQTNR
jgi:RHS repeat-associated protein